mmetsp:Transcript_9399/g.16174  ORF Transcript_9399/g.16174 Transcript_9399/m.16174 type:complete len:276 (-) Transcript_9399:54-881(-)
MCVRQVRVRMAPSEVLRGHGVDNRVDGGAKLVDEDSFHVRSSNSVERIHEHAEVRASNESLQLVKVVDLLHQLQVLVNRVDYLHLEVVELKRADFREVNLRKLCNLNFSNLCRFFIDRVSESFRSRTSICAIVLDAPVSIRAAGVVAGSHQEAAVCFQSSNDTRCSWRGKDPIVAHDYFSGAVGSCDLNNYLTGLLIEIPSVSTKYHGTPFDFMCWEGIERCLNKVVEIETVLEDLHSLAEATRSRFLARNGLCRQRLHSQTHLINSHRLVHVPR